MSKRSDGKCVTDEEPAAKKRKVEVWAFDASAALPEKDEEPTVDIREPLLRLDSALDDDKVTFHKERLAEVMAHRACGHVVESFKTTGVWNRDSTTYVYWENRPKWPVYAFVCHWLYDCRHDRMDPSDIKEMTELVVEVLLGGNLNRSLNSHGEHVLDFAKCLPGPRSFVETYRHRIDWRVMANRCTTAGDVVYPRSLIRESWSRYPFADRELLRACPREEFDNASPHGSVYASVLARALRCSYGGFRDALMQLQERAGLDGTDIDTVVVREDHVRDPMHAVWFAVVKQYRTTLRDLVLATHNERATVYLCLPVVALLPLVAAYLPS
jgi:hypothetical protein